MSYATVTLTGTYVLFDGVTPAKGTIEIIPSVKVVVDDAGNAILSGRVRVQLDDAGHFAVALPATDDPDLNPTGFTYTVAARLHHQHLAAVTFDLPAAVLTVDVSDLTEVAPSAPTYTERVNEATVAAGEAEAAATAAATSATSAATSESSAAASAGAAQTARTGAESAQASAEAAAASVQRDVPGGVAPLDGAGLLPEGNVPARLSEASLSATFGRSVPDDATQEEIASAISSAAASGQPVLLGRHTLTATLPVPTGSVIRGRAGATITMPADAAFPAFDIDASADVRIEGLRVAAAGATIDGATAVRGRGSAERVLLQDLTADGLHVGFRIEGETGTAPGTVRNAALVRCRALNSGNYGYRIDDVDGLAMTDCSSVVSLVDGVKLRKKAINVTITGGSFTGAQTGDGMDAYAGGQLFTVQGASFSGNSINGLTIKTDDLNKTDAASYGTGPRDITLTGLRCNNNGGNGLGIHRNGTADDATEPLVARVSVAGGSFNSNAGHGIFLRARALTLTGVQATNNQGNGIRVEPTAFDVALLGPQIAGNGRRDAMTDGISIAGKRVQIIGGASIGAEIEGVASDADLSAGTKYQRFGLRLESTASDALVIGVTLLYNSTAPLSDSTTSATILQTGGALDVLTLPNGKLKFRNAAGTPVNGVQFTSSGSLTFGENPAVGSMNFLASVAANFFTKLYTSGELEVDGALNHDGAAVGFYGAPPVARAANPGTATGTDAAVINAVVTALRNLGLVT